MKIIRPEQPTKKKEENLTLIIDGHEVTQFTKDEAKQTFNPDEKLIDDNTGKDQTIEQLMDEIINKNSIKVEFTLTKKQFDIWTLKGGVNWLKNVLIKQAKK